MGKRKIDVRVRADASPAALYALLRDGASWPVWSPIGSFELRRHGADEPEGLGAIRVFRTGRVVSVERIAELVPDRRFSYELEHGLPIKNYRADVDLDTDGDGTVIHWHSTFDGKAPGIGLFYQFFLGIFIKRCARGLASYVVTERSQPGR
ncbi:MAG TPA: SRPBCC family protein [Pseudonocardiaceae bacterium]|nr:SRPBCC family protein [Pseudonocardiaceae bacterium]